MATPNGKGGWSLSDSDIEEMRAAGMIEQPTEWYMCLLCDEPVVLGEEAAEGNWLDGQGRRRQAHRECALRNVVGGIGHILDHYLWCKINKDPDGGRTYRQSAILVDKWVQTKGTLS